MPALSSQTRIPPNFFGFAFGLAGLGEVWRVMEGYGHGSSVVPDALSVIAALVWATVLLAYLRHLGSDHGVLKRDLTDQVVAPFLSLAIITPMFLAVVGVAPHALQLGKVLFDIFLALTVLLGGWLTGQWMYGPLDIDKMHPGYFLPTVAGGLIGADGAAVLGQQRLSEVMFGFGTISWLMLGSILLGRIYVRPLPPPALLPTLSIMVAPAGVGSLAWFDAHGDRLDTVATFLAGYGILMILAQLRLLPAYLRLPFMPSTWAFAFSWAAVAGAGIHWLQISRPRGQLAYEYLILAAITVLIGGIAIRTVLAVVRRQLLPHPIVAPVPSPAAEGALV
jgi:tellurite resistance protein